MQAKTGTLMETVRNSKPIDMSESTRWGIIGPGNIALQFANDLKLLGSKQEVSALLGHSDESIREFTDKVQVGTVYKTLDEFIEKAKIDIAYIATPHHLHYEQASACLRAGIPVLCEKPITLNDEQCRQLRDIARAGNIFLMEGMWIRFLPSIRQVVSLIKADKIGAILSIHASIGFNAPDDPESRFFDRDKAGGSLADLGIYPVFLSYLLLGRPDTVKAIAPLTDQKVDESCAMLFHYKDGPYAMLESTLRKGLASPAEIYGEKGIIRIRHPWYEKCPGIELEIFGEGKTDFPCDWEGHGLQFEAAEAVQCLKSGHIESEWLPLETSIAILSIMDGIRKQIKVSYKSAESL